MTDDWLNYTPKLSLESNNESNAAGQVNLPADAALPVEDAARNHRAMPAPAAPSEKPQSATPRKAAEQVVDHATGQVAYALNDTGRAVLPHRSGDSGFPAQEPSSEQIVRDLFEQECKDGDRLCEALGVERTEGGRLNVGKMLAKIRTLQDLARKA